MFGIGVSLVSAVVLLGVFFGWLSSLEYGVAYILAIFVIMFILGVIALATAPTTG